MIPLVLLLVAVAIVLVVASLSKGYRTKNNKKLPPGPFPWPFVGNVKEFRELSRKLGGQHNAVIELSKQYGSPIISLKLGSGNVIVVNGAELVNAVLNAEEFDGRPWNFFIKCRNMGRKKGITINDGEEWREIRGWFVKSMRLVGFGRREMSEYIQEEVIAVLDSIPEDGVQKMKPLIIPVIINILWVFATGKRFDETRLKYFIDLMDRRAQAFDMTGGLLTAYPWIRFIAPEYSGYNLLVTVNDEFKSVLTETIEEHKKNHVMGSEADMIDMFLNEMYSNKGPRELFDDDQLICILIDVLLAGLSITTTSIEFLFLNMLINQDSQRRLHEEIDRVIGRDKLPDDNDRKKMPYAEAVIMESLRLVPVFPLLGPRRVMKDTELLGYSIPKDTSVLMNLYSISSDPEIYPEPQKFKPERFLNNGSKIRDENLLFFGKGHRKCPGMSLAKNAVFILFIGIMQKYELLPVPGQKPPTLQFNTGINLTPKPYEVYLKSRGTQK